MRTSRSCASGQRSRRTWRRCGATSRPISVARGAYWQGRAAEAAGDKSGATGFYQAAARYPITYYGQIARARLGLRTLDLNALPEATPGNMSELNFGSLAKLNLLTEFNPGQNIDVLLKHPWLRGSRIQLRVDNVFDARQRVTDQNGATPAAYLPNLRDPVGRTVRLTFRKQFF